MLLLNNTILLSNLIHYQTNKHQDCRHNDLTYLIHILLVFRKLYNQIIVLTIALAVPRLV